MAELFVPLTLRDVTFRNRAFVSPMCMYSVAARDGVPTEWHLVHYGKYAQGGFGLVMTEATSVNPQGRISAFDTGIWNDEQREAWRRIVEFGHSQGARMGIQLAHAGRKGGSSRELVVHAGQPPITDAGGWPIEAPSAVAFPGYREPAALTAADIDRVVSEYVAAAGRARAAGFDLIEIHAAHGYLLHEFYSPLSNLRSDEYGGDLTGRVRLLLRIVDEVRSVWAGVLFVRISATDWVPDGWTGADSVVLAGMLREHGVDLIDVSTGGNISAEIPLGPGYQVRFAADIRRETGIPTASVGLITDPRQAETIIATEQADAVFLGRVALREPSWPLRAAHELGLTRDQAPYLPQETRGAWPR